MSHSPTIVPVNALNFQQEVLDAAEPVLIDVSAAWCPPCRAAAPVIAAIAAEYAGRLKVVEIDGDESPELVAKLACAASRPSSATPPVSRASGSPGSAARPRWRVWRRSSWLEAGSP